MGDSRPSESPSGGSMMDNCREKLKKWSKECLNLFKCYNCYKSKVQFNLNPDSGDRPNLNPSTGARGATESGEVKGGNSPQKVPVTHTQVSEVPPETTETSSSGPPIKTTTSVEQEDTSLGLYTPQLHEYSISVHTLKDFPPEPFQSPTYEGAYIEIQKWVRPLQYNPTLQSAFLNYTAPPKTMDKLHILSTSLQKVETAMKKNKKPPDNKHPDITPIIDELSMDPGIRMDEVKSLIILSEALMEFPQHIVKRAIDLPQDKRQVLVEFMCHTPYGIHKHVYMDEGPFNDPDLYPIMTRMGFSIPSHTNRLTYEASDDNDDDMLAAGFFLLLGTAKK